MSRPSVVLFDRYSSDRDFSEVSQLALRAWPAILARPDVAPEAAAALAYRAAKAMLEEVRQAEGAYDLRLYQAEGARA
jgi:hypothetical protein